MRNRNFIIVFAIFIIIIVMSNLQNSQVKAVEEEFFINKSETAIAFIDDEGILTIKGTGIIGEGVDKTRYVDSYKKDVGTNNISEDSEVVISDFWNKVDKNIKILDVKKIVIQEGITGIENDIFSQCDNLVSIEIPSTVSYIGDKAFNYTYGLENIIVDENNPNFSSENGILFNKDKTELICYPKGKSDLEYSIPQSVTNIKDLAFVNTSEIATVQIPESVTQIGIGAFRSCYNLSEIIVAESNPNYLSIDGILFNKDKTELICYPSQKEGDNYKIDETVKTIKEYAFSNNYYLKQVDIQTVENIERGAFYWVQLLENVEMPLLIEQMGTAVFSGCTSLKTVKLPEGITKIEACTFTDCYELESVQFPKGILEIGDYSFVGCSSLKEIAIPMGVTKLGIELFQGCYILEKIYIPNTVVEVGSLGEEVKDSDIYCKSGTTIEKYLKEENYNYVADDMEPVILISYSNLEKTKDPVEVTIRTLEKVIPIEGWQISSQGMKLSKKYESNENETITLTDLVGNNIQVNIKIENIDNISPKVVATYQKEDNNVTKVILVSNEELQELEGWILSEDKMELSKEYTDLEEEQVVVKDIVGNETSVDITNVNFVAEVNYSSKEEKQEKVDVTILADRELQELEGWILSEDKMSLTREFRENVKWAVTIADTNDNTTTVKVEINNIDNQPPEVVVNYSIIEPTKEDIIVTLTANESIQAIEGWTLSEDNLMLTKEYSQNVNEEIEVKDLVGNIQKVEINIENYDSTPANIEVSYNSIGDTDKKIEVTLTADEELQELEGWILSEDKKQLVKIYEEKTTEEVIVKDLAGNETTVNIDIQDFIVAVSYSTTQITKEPVIVTIKSDVQLQELEGWELSEDNLILTKSYNDNIQELLTVKDIYNNESKVMIQISNIDVLNPEVEIKYSEVTITNNDIIVTINTNEPVQEVEGWELSEDKLQLTKTYTENSVEEVIVTDLAGNDTKTMIKIGNIDKKSPELQVNYERKYNNPENEEEGYKTIVTIIADEVIQEVEGWELSEDGHKLEKIFDANSKEIVEVRDIVGNKTNVEIDIGELELEVKYDKIGSSPVEVVVVSIISNRELKPLEGWELSENKKILTKSYAENINTYITIEDITGNVNYVDILITDIGKSTIKGDINQDNKIDSADLLAVLRYIATIKDEQIANNHPEWIIKDEKLDSADINSDGNVDVTDVLKIQRHIAAEKSDIIKEKHPDWIISNS